MFEIVRSGRLDTGRFAADAKMTVSNILPGTQQPAATMPLPRLASETHNRPSVPNQVNQGITLVRDTMPRDTAPVIHSDPEILGGTPVFVGTRVPAQSLIDYLEGGHTVDEFLDDFPSVSRDQVIAALELARDALRTPPPAA